jgi:hypothetical protein
MKIKLLDVIEVLVSLYISSYSDTVFQVINVSLLTLIILNNVFGDIYEYIPVNLRNIKVLGEMLAIVVVMKISFIIPKVYEKLEKDFTRFKVEQ